MIRSDAFLNVSKRKQENVSLKKFPDNPPTGQQRTESKISRFMRLFDANI